MNLTGYLEKKKSSYFFQLFLSFLFIFISTPSHSCDIREITTHHSSFLKALKLPKNSLLSIVKNKISLITSEEIRAQIKATGSKELKIYHNVSDRLVLKGIANVDLNFNNINFIGRQKLSNITHTFISQNGVFIIVDKLNPNEMPSCYTGLFYSSNSTKPYYNNFSTAAKTKNENQKLTKSLIISNLLSANHNFSYVNNVINLNLKAHENNKDLVKKVSEFQQVNPKADHLIIKPQRAGLQISEMQMPISSYNRTLKFKDGNELFYLTTFRKSKNPNLIKSEPYYQVDVGLRKEKTYLDISSNFNFTKNLHSNFGLQYTEKELNISQLYLGFKSFNKTQLLYSSKFGKFSKSNAGFLLNMHKLNIKNDSLMNITTYLGLNSNCNDCIKNGVSVGFEQYQGRLSINTRANLLYQRFDEKSETLLELKLTKQLPKQNQLIVSTQYNINTKDPNIFIRFKMPLNTTQTRKNNTVSFSYLSKKTNMISNWSQHTNKALIENTPNFLKRNWKNYINFNQP